MNKVILSGRLTRDPEVRYTQKSMAWCSTGIAVDRRYLAEKATDFFNLVAWDKTAETMGKYLKKGSKILVDGHLQFNQYEDKNGYCAARYGVRPRNNYEQIGKKNA